jgi:hypothetical protein
VKLYKTNGEEADSPYSFTPYGFARPQLLASLATDDESFPLFCDEGGKDPNDPQAGFYGSTMIVEFDSREALDEWLKEEPFFINQSQLALVL